MTNQQRFRAVMKGEHPDRVPLLIFSELLPGNTYQSLIKPAGGGLIVHSGSVHQKRQLVRETNDLEAGLRVQRLHTTKGILRAAYKTNLKSISGSGEVQVEWFVKERSDYDAMIEALDDIEFYLDSSQYERTLRMLGNDGVTHTWCDEPPYMGLQYLLGYEAWAMHQYDHPDTFRALLNAYGNMQRKRMLLQAQAPEKDLINLGNLAGNYSPDAFARYVMPYFEEYGALLRAAGCSVTVHADALNLSIHKHVFPGRELDVVEAFTPPPVGDFSLAQARSAWGQDLVYHINIPETLFYSGPDYVYEWTRDLLVSDSNPRKFLSFTELGFLGVTGEKLQLFTKGMQGLLRAMNDYGRY